MSLFKKPRSILEPPIPSLDTPGNVYLHFALEINCPACMVKLTTVYVYEMNRQDLTYNKLIGVRTPPTHCCVPSFVPGEGKITTEASRYGK